MIQQFHFWVYTAAPPELKAGVEETCAPVSVAALFTTGKMQKHPSVRQGKNG